MTRYGQRRSIAENCRARVLGVALQIDRDVDL
jgi:hypothetical protein